MCMIDYSDADTEFSQSYERRARKTHRCAECGRIIQRGEIYKYASGKSYGEMWDARQCAHCRVAADWLSLNCRGFLYEEVIEDFAEHATGNLGMLRIVVGAKRQWKSFADPGLLMMVPAYPKDMIAHVGH